MVSPEREGRSTTSDRSDPSDDADAGTKPSKAGAVSQKLKLIARYAMLGFAPVVSVAALIIAVLAFTGNQSSQEQIDKAFATMDSLNTGMAANKSELDRLRFSIAHDKSRLDDERERQEKREERVIQSVSQLQVKAKISPTLEEQLLQPASAPVAAASAPAATPASVAPATAPATAPAGAAKKTDARMQGLKEAIEKLNKQ